MHDVRLLHDKSTSEGSFIQLGNASGLTFPEPARSASSSRNGDVFIFVNKNRNRIKLLCKEPGGLVIYAMMLDYGRLRLPSIEQGAISRVLEWRDLAGMIRHVVEDPNYRLRCLRSGVRIY